MASFNNKSTRFTLRVQTGTTPEGDPKYSSVGWGNISDSATADQMDTLALALEGFFAGSVGEVQRSAVDQVL